MPNKREMFVAMMDFYRRNMASIRPVERTQFIPQVEVQTLGHTNHRKPKVYSEGFAGQDQPLAGPPPQIDSISPTSGSDKGGTLCTIHGQNLNAPGLAIDFIYDDGTEVNEYLLGNVATDGTSALFTTLAAIKLGIVDVKVYTDFGDDTLTNGYTYIPGLTITSVVPNTGAITGGYQVVVNGTGFKQASLTLKFGGTNVGALTVPVNGKTATILSVPAHALGVVDVTAIDGVTNEQFVLRGGFTYGTVAVPGYGSISQPSGSPFVWTNTYITMDSGVPITFDIYLFDFPDPNGPPVIATGFNGSLIMGVNSPPQIQLSFNPALGQIITFTAGKASLSAVGYLLDPIYVNLPYIIYLNDPASSKIWQFGGTVWRAP